MGGWSCIDSKPYGSRCDRDRWDLFLTRPRERVHALFALSVNWASASLHPWRDGIMPSGAITGLVHILSNPDNHAGFRDEKADDFRPVPGAQVVQAGMQLHDLVISLGHPVLYEYLPTASAKIRDESRQTDLGAFAAHLGLFRDRFEVAGPVGVVWRY